MCSRQVELVPVWPRPERESPVRVSAWEWLPVLRSQTEGNLHQQPEVKNLAYASRYLRKRLQPGQRQGKEPKRP